MTLIRPETQADIAAVRAISVAAFAGTAEADLLDRLRADGDLVLSLVAEDASHVVGYIAFSRLKIVDGPLGLPALSLAPLAVHPDFQRRGIGGALIESAHALLRQRGESLSLVVGDPAYYGRFGYLRQRAANFESEYQGDYFMGRSFAAAPRTGKVIYPVAFRELA